MMYLIKKNLLPTVTESLGFTRIIFYATIIAITLLLSQSNLADTLRTPFPDSVCTNDCEENILYKSTDSPLRFSLYNLTSGTSSEHWRHGYEIVLTESPGSLSVFDHLTNEHRFSVEADDSYQPMSGTQGHLARINDNMVWTNSADVRHTFADSRLMRITFPTQGALALDYLKGQLHTIIDDTGRQITVGYAGNQLEWIQLPDGSIKNIISKYHHFRLAEDVECRPDGPPQSADTVDNPDIPATSIELPADQEEAEQEPSCDLGTEPQHEFHPIESAASNLYQLDARPASCESYFVEYYGTVRGFEIEAGLVAHPPYSNMTSTIRVFPVIDFIDGSDLYVVHSRDLGSNAYSPISNPDGLLNALLEDGEEIQQNFLDPINQNGQISANELGQSTTILAEDVDTVTLQLVIRDGIAGPDHWRQIQAAREQLFQQYGIQLQVIVIP